MKFKIFLPLFFLSLVGCDSLQDGKSEEPLSHKYEEQEVVKPAGKSDHDPAVVPHTNYPSIVEVEISENEENSSTKKDKKAKQVLNLGKEKIKVYDESMGSVNEASLKKLRDQVK
jgi:hypothetical protein